MRIRGILGGGSLLQDKLKVKPFLETVSTNGNNKQGSSTYSKNISNY